LVFVYFVITSEISALVLQNPLSVESDDLLPSVQSDPMKQLGWYGDVVCSFTRLPGLFQ
jgi:hypothetical protein